MYQGNQFVWRSSLTSIQKLVMLSLCETCDHYGRVQFSEHTLADTCSISTKDTRRILKDLAGMKMIHFISSSRLNRDIDEWIAVSIIGGG